MEELVNKFNQLTDDEKIEFFKTILPTTFETFKGNPQKLMSEILPLVMVEFKKSGIDLNQLLAMAAMMKQ